MSKTMKENLEFLKRDRSANSTAFEKKLNDVGLEIEYGIYSYSNHEPYVQIGETKVFLVEEYSPQPNSWALRWRKQNAVIADIKEAIEIEVSKAEKADASVKEFFEKLSA